jgi:hypothetical protein
MFSLHFTGRKYNEYIPLHMSLIVTDIKTPYLCIDETRTCDECTVLHKDAVSKHAFEFISLGFKIFVKMSDLTLYTL